MPDVIVVTTFLFCVSLPVLVAEEINREAGGPDICTVDQDAVPEAVLAQIQPQNSIRLQDAPLKQSLRTIAGSFGLNLFVHESIIESITVHISEGTLLDLLIFVCERYDLQLKLDRGILSLNPLPAPSPIERVPDLTIREDRLYANLKSDSLHAVLRRFSELTPFNILPEYGVSGVLNGFVKDEDAFTGLRAILNGNGFRLRERDGFWYAGTVPTGARSKENRAVWVETVGDSIRVESAEALLDDILREIRAALPEVEIILRDDLAQVPITGYFEARDISECLHLLFADTPMRFRKVGDTYVISGSGTESEEKAQLIRLHHAKSEAVLSYLPNRLTARSEILVVREQNGLLVSGPSENIREIESIAAQLDIPTPQILIQALVVDFTVENEEAIGVQWSSPSTTTEDALATRPSIEFGPVSESGGSILTYSGGAKQLRGFGRFFSDLLGTSFNPSGPAGSLLHFVGRLPDDFFFRIEALSRKGLARIRSKPHVATLNGHTAKLSFGETQYYLLSTTNYFPYSGSLSIDGSQDETTGPFPGNGSGFSPSVSQRFQTIDANVSFEITPWVGQSGEITAEIKPEFKTPQGGFEQGVPPTISTRSLESTIRLRDGETIVLGGLIQDREEVTYDKVPILGDIPLLGRLFRNRSKRIVRQELVIFVTPHVFMGTQSDDSSWQAIRETYESYVPPPAGVNTHQSESE